MNPPALRALPIIRGCGERSPGGVYAECGLSPFGTPLETCLLDPPLQPPAGLDLANKAQLWEDPRSDPAQPVVHLLIWIGAEHYPYLPDFLEEAKRFGISRKLSPFLDFARLGPASRMMLVHPKAYNTAWADQALPRECAKHVTGHDLTEPLVPAQGPCLFKTYELMPRDAALDPHDPLPLDGCDWYARTIGSTDYLFAPTSEAAEGLRAGIFAALPITGFALIRRLDGTVNERAEAALRKSQLPSYHADA